MHRATRAHGFATRRRGSAEWAGRRELAIAGAPAQHCAYCICTRAGPCPLPRPLRSAPNPAAHGLARSPTPTRRQQLAQTLGSNANFMFNLVNGFIQPYPLIPVGGVVWGGGEAGWRASDGLLR
jgi:hypothetical protein